MKVDLYMMLVMIATFAPIILFGAIALLAKSSAPTFSYEDEYMLAGRNINRSDFINSSTGYMLQVSTTFYFIYWGYNYGFSNVFYLISWALGICFFAYFSPALIKFRLKFKSLPEWLAHGNNSFSRILSALATVISFIGVFYVEAYFTTDFITNIASPNKIQMNGFGIIWWVIFGSLILLILLYSISGGLRKVILTDVWQLAGAYIGLAIVFSYLLEMSYSVDLRTSIILSCLCIVIYSILLFEGSGFKEGIIVPTTIVIGLFVIVITSIYGIYNSHATTSNININGFLKQVTEPWGWVTLLGFTIINITWQFCDNSNFQRIGALSLPNNPVEAADSLKKSLRKLTLVSPLTWGLGIVIGMLIKSAAITVAVPGTEYQSLVDLLKNEAINGNYHAMIVIFALIISLISIMMSTCDTALIAAVQVIHKDFKGNKKLTKGFLLLTMLVIIVIVTGLALIHKVTSSSSILTVMAGVYSAILVLFPTSLNVLLDKPIKESQIIGSIVCGLIATFYCTFWAPDYIPFNIKLVLPILSGFLTSIVAFFVFKLRYFK